MQVEATNGLILAAFSDPGLACSACLAAALAFPDMDWCAGASTALRQRGGAGGKTAMGCASACFVLLWSRGPAPRPRL
jgi:hypothetical protein